MKKEMEIRIRQVQLSELDRAFELIWEVFQKFVAPDYSEEGISTFYEQYIMNEKFREKFESGKEIMYGAYDEDKLIGVLSISQNNTVSCVFVDGEYHHMGVGKKLFSFIISQLRHKGIKNIKLNASPYAEAFYHFLGFQDIGEKSSYHGIVYTPMELNLN